MIIDIKVEGSTRVQRLDLGAHEMRDLAVLLPALADGSGGAGVTKYGLGSVRATIVEKK